MLHYTEERDVYSWEDFLEAESTLASDMAFLRTRGDRVLFSVDLVKKIFTYNQVSVKLMEDLNCN